MTTRLLGRSVGRVIFYLGPPMSTNGAANSALKR